MATLLKNIYSQEFIEKLSNSLQNSCKDFKVDEFKNSILRLIVKTLVNL